MFKDETFSLVNSSRGFSTALTAVEGMAAKIPSTHSSHQRQMAPKLPGLEAGMRFRNPLGGNATFFGSQPLAFMKSSDQSSSVQHVLAAMR